MDALVLPGVASHVPVGAASKRKFKSVIFPLMPLTDNGMFIPGAGASGIATGGPV